MQTNIRECLFGYGMTEKSKIFNKYIDYFQ